MRLGVLLNSLYKPKMAPSLKQPERVLCFGAQAGDGLLSFSEKQCVMFVHERCLAAFAWLYTQASKPPSGFQGPQPHVLF